MNSTTNVCPQDSTCINSVGSFTCNCNNNGYSYNGTSCIGWTILFGIEKNQANCF